MKKNISFIFALCFTLICFTSCSNKSENKSKVETGTIAVLSGSIYDNIAADHYPNAKIIYYNTIPEMVLAVKNGKADAFIQEEITLEDLFYKNPGLKQYGNTLETLDYCFIFTDGKCETARENLNEFILKLEKSGELNKIVKDYSSVNTEIPDPPEITTDGHNGKILVADTSDIFPFCYLINGKMTGIDVAILNSFANEYDYDVSIIDYDSKSLLETISSGKCDLAGSGYNYTEERAAIYDFTIPYLKGGVTTIVYDSELDNSLNGLSIASLRQSIQKNFIDENRWKMVLEGIGITVLITLVSAVIGTIAGFILYLIYTKGKAAEIILKTATLFIYGLPMVVLLMILYYIIFASTNLSGTAVSIIGFSLTFAISVFNIIKSGVESIDYGQTEAGLTLGYSKWKTFFKWVFPQAIQAGINDYKYELNSLIKATSVVGYIAVQDLTKVNDIIRSRTFEAFFPLLITAVIYFILGGVLMFIVGYIADRFNPLKRDRTKFLRGIKQK